MEALKITAASFEIRLPQPSARSMLEEQIELLCSQAAGVVVGEYEVEDGSVDGVLLDRTRALVLAALDVLEVVSLLYGEEAESRDPIGVEPREDEGSEPPVDGEDIADTVALARMGLRGRLRALQALGEGAARVERLTAAGGALRTIQKALCAVLRAMVGAERVPTSMGFYRQNVERSLEIRRRYLELQRAVAGAAPPREHELRLRLRLAGNSIAGLLGQRIAVHIRTEDRALLLVSHGRVRAWLRSQDGDEIDAAAGLRLWQDICNVMTMFLDVNRREELVEHDGGVVRQVLCALPESQEAWSEDARRGALGQLDAVRGRSPSLDAILQSPAGEDLLWRLRQALEDLSRTLGPAPDEAPLSGRRRLASAPV